MRILNRLGGIELSSAYACIKAISKKKQDIIDQRRADFIQGAQERGLDEADGRGDLRPDRRTSAATASTSRTAAAYAQVGYQTAYLKAHYTPEFMAALLSSEIEDGNKRDIMVEHIDDARRLGVEVLPPDVNASEADFTGQGRQDRLRPDGDQGRRPRRPPRPSPAPRRGRAVQATSSISANASICKVVSRAALEKLIKAGALDCLGGHRASCWHVVAARPAGGRRAAEGPAPRPEATSSRRSAATAAPATGRPARPCRTCRSGRQRKSSSTRRKRSTSTFPAIRWRSARRSCAASPPHRRQQLQQLPAEQEVTLGGMLIAGPLHEHQEGAQRQQPLCALQARGLHRLRRVRDVARRLRPPQGRGAGRPRLLRPRLGGTDARGAGPGAQPHPQPRTGPARTGAGCIC